MLGAVAVFIINRNRAFLGGSVPPRTEAVRRMLQADDMVVSVQDVKSIQVGSSGGSSGSSSSGSGGGGGGGGGSSSGSSSSSS